MFLQQLYFLTFTFFSIVVRYAKLENKNLFKMQEKATLTITKKNNPL